MLAQFFLRKIFPSITWRISTQEKILFLTFDDGPIPEVTPQVLQLLKKYNAKATFFCIGENIKKHPEVFKMVLDDGHSIGNHTYNHLNGWKTDSKKYLENVELCQSEIRNQKSETKFFRPPFGRISFSQISNLKSQTSIVMWDVLSEDWKQNLSAEDCFEKVKRKAKPGSIIVFHDSLKAEKRMLPALEKTLQYFSEKGFRFQALPSSSF
jgi:peptidoglycan/xylan/chitin deacetylase (PgdA/CDA1 family)